MRITDLLKKDAIALNVAVPANKEAAIHQLTDLMEKNGNLADKAQYVKDVLYRESSGTTGLGAGVAAPHAKSKGVKAPGLAAMTIPDGMDFASMDGKPSRLFFEIAAPADSGEEHLEIFSKLTTMITDPDFKKALINAKTPDEFLKFIDDKEDGKFVAPSAAKASNAAKSKDNLRITDLLKSDAIALNATVPASKDEAIYQLTDLMEKNGNLTDKAQYVKDVLYRESSGTTGLGEGVAAPHAKSKGVKAPGLAAMTIPGGMDFKSMDGKPSRLFFEIAAPADSGEEHLAIFSNLAKMLLDPAFKEALIAAKTKEEFLNIIDEKENGNFHQ